MGSGVWGLSLGVPLISPRLLKAAAAAAGSSAAPKAWEGMLQIISVVI